MRVRERAPTCLLRAGPALAQEREQPVAQRVQVLTVVARHVAGKTLDVEIPATGAASAVHLRPRPGLVQKLERQVLAPDQKLGGLASARVLLGRDVGVRD